MLDGIRAYVQDLAAALPPVKEEEDGMDDYDTSDDDDDGTLSSLLAPATGYRKEFHHAPDFDFTKELEENWQVIRTEFEELNNQLFHPWPEQNLYKQNGIKGKGNLTLPLSIIVPTQTGWDVFGLYAFGKKHFRNARLCPRTTEMIERIPGMSTAAFSILTPKSRIVPHVGYYGYSEMILRCHLGLIIPKEKEACYLSVGPFNQHWEEGRCMVFDDTFLHSATNNTEETRVVLLLDFSAGSLPEGCEELVEEKKPPIDQTAYLDQITAQYGYGIKEDEGGAEPNVDNCKQHRLYVKPHQQHKSNRDLIMIVNFDIVRVGRNSPWRHCEETISIDDVETTRKTQTPTQEEALATQKPSEKKDKDTRVQ
ncbi:aspartyl/asparaginyl beta-hydroxylase-like dioxygenase [Planoprotostelium fungivorum]|uniref:Aspartyl/asparaginyl beta-hydroxylase-like dioxygenase n=1 Tax=Planoprotostelium fungivorum TaxID=1890364 RepID=A0A2P6NJG4_9EUKA|nr:aspartyl/asparaginyl beta-hydroxylase-like dioxygenase [Planoprotostelium fungivorum]